MPAGYNFHHLAKCLLLAAGGRSLQSLHSAETLAAFDPGAHPAAFISQFSLKSMAAFQLDAWFKAAILIVPVVFLWTIYGQSLGTDAFEKRLLQAGQSVPFKAIDLDKISSTALTGKVTSLLDLILYAEKFKGKSVAVEGMVFRGANESNNSFTLFRFAVACCAADALPFSIGVKAANEENLENDTWVRVVGHFNFETINNKQVSSILADKVLTIPTPPPEKRYLFF